MAPLVDRRVLRPLGHAVRKVDALSKTVAAWRRNPKPRRQNPHVIRQPAAVPQELPVRVVATGDKLLRLTFALDLQDVQQLDPRALLLRLLHVCLQQLVALALLIERGQDRVEFLVVLVQHLHLRRLLRGSFAASSDFIP